MRVSKCDYMRDTNTLLERIENIVNYTFLNISDVTAFSETLSNVNSINTCEMRFNSCYEF